MSQYSYSDVVRNTFQARIYDVARRTDIDFMPNLSAVTNNQVWIKREDKQPIFSFKIRGAYHKISQLPSKLLKNGVCAASAGNHAQGVAMSAKKLGIKAKIFMPLNTASIKLNAVKRLEAEVILTGGSFSEVHSLATAEAKKTGASFIEAFNDHMIIAGQGTVGLEIIQDCPELPDAVFVPIGGGGLISGIAVLIKELYPDIKIIGVEPRDSNAMTASIRQNKVAYLPYVNTFADGVAIKQVGNITFDYCKKFVDDYINVTTDEICSATKIIHNELRALPEPSGALGVAGILAFLKKNRWKNKNLVTVNTGANMDFDRLKFIVERTKIGEGREVLLVVQLTERPGTLKDFCQQVLSGIKISEFNYRYDNPNKAVIFLGLEFSNAVEVSKVYTRLKKFNYVYHELTNNELAKYHLRYMVGGKANVSKRERFFQFTFPEDPNALYAFLDKMVSDWNISLFHYRSYGGDFGKIFMGIHSPPTDHRKLDNFIEYLNCQFTEETNNPGFKMLFPDEISDALLSKPNIP